MSRLSKEIKTREGLIRASGVIFLSGLILILAACGTAPPAEIAAATPSPELESSGELIPNLEQDAEPSMEESAYPPPVEMSEVEEAYPAEPLPAPSPTLIPDSYPAQEEVYAEPRFRIDLPLTTVDDVVTGQAPPNLSLAIVDISSGGIILGSGVSTSDGQFSIGVANLPDGHRVGITFSDLQPGKTYVDMSEEYFPHRGDGFMNVPNIGIFFDSTLVTP